ncbi:helix-turn-helix domain-containing protein [Nocardia sp. NPDC055029]
MMARRPRALDPAAGPVVQFALKLRALRDSAGLKAPTVDQIAKSGHVSRSAIFKALNGAVLPSRQTLAAMVDAWGRGDHSFWIEQRNRYEEASELLRLEREGHGFAGSASASDTRSTFPPVLSREDKSKDASSLVVEEARHAMQMAAKSWKDLLDAIELLRMTAEGKQRSYREIVQLVEDADLGYGLSVGTLHNFLTGRTFPSRKTALGIAIALGGDAEQFNRLWAEASRWEQERHAFTHGTHPSL